VGQKYHSDVFHIENTNGDYFIYGFGFNNKVIKGEIAGPYVLVFTDVYSYEDRPGLIRCIRLLICSLGGNQPYYTEKLKMWINGDEEPSEFHVVNESGG
jgi:hypothetical protein